MFAHITVAQGYITPENATTEIPRLINTAIAERRPVHLHLPIDVAISEIEIPTPFEVTAAKDTDASTYIELLASKLHQSKQPIIITGHEINSFHLHQELEDFVNQTQIPVAQLSLGKVLLMRKIHIIWVFTMGKLPKIKYAIMWTTAI